MAAHDYAAGVGASPYANSFARGPHRPPGTSPRRGGNMRGRGAQPLSSPGPVSISLNNTAGTQRRPYTDESDSYDARRQAGEFLEHQINRDDKLPELYDLLSGDAKEYVPDSRPQFYKKKIVTLPDALLDAYNQLEFKCFMGLFAEINRAWVTIDNRIFLWNYHNGVDFVTYDELDQIIISAGLVRPKPGVFVDEISHLLILATPVEIVVLGVCLSDGSVFGDLTLYPTQLSVPSDNVNMLKIVGTESGRVFMCGKDGHLYELTYQAEDGWFTRKCRKLDRSQWFLGPYLPSFLQFGADDAIVDIAVDDTRNVLYTLSESSVIQVFDLGNGNTIRWVTAASEIYSRAPSGVRFNSDSFRIVAIHPVPANESKSVHLIAITSAGFRFYMTTSELLYSRRPNPNTRAAGLELLYVRRPPRPSTETSPESELHIDGFTDIHSTAYADGVVVMADSYRENSDIVVGCFQDYTSVTRRRTVRDAQKVTSSLSETASIVTIEGKTWALAEVPLSVVLHLNSIPTSSARVHAEYATKSPTSSLPTQRTLGGTRTLPHVRNELATQHVLPPRQFISLTNTGLHQLVKLRPVDQLQLILKESRGAETETLAHFFKRYGEDQACAMCLILACASAHTNPASHSLMMSPAYGGDSVREGEGSVYVSAVELPDSQIVTWARRAFFMFGGEARKDHGTITTNTGNGVDIGRAVKAPEIVFSGMHTGLYMFLGRVLRPAWPYTIMVRVGDDGRETTSTTSNSNQRCRLSKSELVEIEGMLMRLQEFLDSAPNFTAQSHPVYDNRSLTKKVIDLQHRRSAEEARVEERASLENLKQLLRYCIEGVAFLHVVASHPMPRIVKTMSSDTQKRVAALTFASLVTTKEGGRVAREIVSAIINHYIEENSPLTRISEVMRTRCPAFFSVEDLTRYQGFELLYKGEHANGETERRDLLRQSLELFVQSANTVDLKEVCDKYIYRRFYEGVLDLGLAKAAATDPEGLAEQWVDNGEQPADKDGHDAWERRKAAYTCITTALEELYTSPRDNDSSRPRYDDAQFATARVAFVDRAVTSTDPLFHNVLYTWFIRSGRGQELLERVRSRFLEEYLKRHEFEHVDLLWKYYVISKRFRSAAYILKRLAEADGPARLEQRIEYLALALSNAQSVTGGGDLGSGHDGEDVMELQDKMEIAQIQLQLLNSLKATPVGLSNEEKNERSRAITELDSRLFDISSMYNRYANKFRLWDCCLALCHASTHDDATLIQNIWRQIIADEKDASGLEHSIQPLSSRVTMLFTKFYPSESTIPFLWLVSALEEHSFDARSSHVWTPRWVFDAFHRGGVPFDVLFFAYDSLVNAKSGVWREKRHSRHILSVVNELLRAWRTHAGGGVGPSAEAQHYLAHRKTLQTAITGYRSMVASLSDSDDLSAQFDELSKSLRTRR